MIAAQADGSVLAPFDDGLMGLREGKVQQMTTKNGLPCDFVISFIQDKEKRWWLYTRVRHRRIFRFRASTMVGQSGAALFRTRRL